MSKRSWIVAVALVCAANVAAPLGVGAQQPKNQPKAGKKDAGKDLFDLNKVWQFNIEMTAANWDKMQQVVGGMPFFGGGFGAPKKAPDKAEKPADVHKNGGFGTEFPWATATFSADGKSYKYVGIRYKGNSTYMTSAGMLQKPLQLDLEHLGEEQRFYGQKKLNFRNGVVDTSRLREPLAYGIYRAAGVPAPRTAYAEVALTVPGKYDKEHVGLYTLIEQVSGEFLKNHFKNNNGMLLKPEMVGGSLEYLGEEWAPYEAKYQPKDPATAKQKKRLIEFTKLVNKGTDQEFQKKINSYLDVDEFLRYLAVTGLIVNFDSFIGTGHNYFLYLREDNNKFAFIPWDLDIVFATFPFGGTPEQQLDLSIDHPHTGPNKLIDRLLAIKEYKDQYRKIVKQLAETVFTKEKLLKDITALEITTKELLVKEKKAVDARNERGGFGFGLGGGGFNMFGQPPTLKEFVEKRTASVAAQLAGTSKGYEPAGLNLPFGGGFGGGAGGAPGGAFGGKGGFPGGGFPGGGFGGKGGFPGGGFGGKGGFGGFGMGQFLAPELLREMDANGDKEVSPEEMQSWVKKVFKDNVKDGKALDDKSFAPVMGKLMPGLGGFGGLGGGKAPGPGGFDMSQMMGRQFLTKIDPAGNGVVTQEKMLGAFAKFSKEWDKNKNGTVDETELTEGLNQLFGPPPGFGGPPGVPFGPGKKDGGEF